MKAMLLTALVLVGVADAPKQPTSARPAVLVLKVKGTVVADGRLGKRPIAAGDLLLPGERVEAAANGEARLLFLLRNELRRLKPSGRITLTRDDCDPADAVEKVAGPPKLLPQNLTKVREVEVREGGGIGVVRGDKPASEGRVEPLFGTLVTTPRPAFSWPALDKARSYSVELSDASGRKLWKATTRETRLPYPEKDKPLQYSQGYLWTVKATLADDDDKTVVQDSKFTLPFEDELKELEEVRKLTESDSEEELVLAAAAWEGYRMLDEALRVFEKLARLNPKVARYQLALARYYEHAGRLDKARECREKAKQLGVKAMP